MDRMEQLRVLPGTLQEAAWLREQMPEEAERSLMRWYGEDDALDQHFAGRLPDLCFSVLPDDGTLILIQRGESSYQVSKDSREDPGLNRHMANYRNRYRGISKAQGQVMLNGCLHGWNSPAADPARYKKPQMGGMSLA